MHTRYTIENIQLKWLNTIKASDSSSYNDIITIIIIINNDCWDSTVATGSQHHHPHTPNTPFSKWNAFNFSYSTFFLYHIRIIYMNYSVLLLLTLSSSK